VIAQRRRYKWARDKLVEVVAVGDAGQQDQELVAADAGGHVVGAWQPRMRWATWTSSRSPAAWPRRSLTRLKPFRSRHSLSRQAQWR
jgi:hypothetical protein